jgi:beta-keto acid cleavage enzyme
MCEVAANVKTIFGRKKEFSHAKLLARGIGVEAGISNVACPVLEAALQHGYDTRIGLEDTLTLPDGSQAKDNAELVAFARSKAESIGLI